MPNVGKSTLFNALLKKQVAFVANYPFATIEPNVGVVPVPDPRLRKLVEITKEEEKMDGFPPIIPAVVNFIDIAGLVKGANQGAGLGNKFLSHIREVSIIAHVVRSFADESIIREGSVAPESDYLTIKTELVLADLATVQNVQSRIKRFQSEVEKSAIEKLYKGLNDAQLAREIELSDEEKAYAKTLFLLSDKQELVVLNVSEKEYNEENIARLTEEYSRTLSIPKNRSVVICVKVEADLAALSEQEQKEYLKSLGVSESGLERLIRKAYEVLGLISFLTAGEKEVRAWTIEKGTSAVEAAGVIHTDFMKNFIKAEVVSFEDYVACGGRKKAREKGLARLEGRDYIVHDGDVVEFKIGT